ncbi:hypothetical protein AQUCO_00700097v1 [Aquilegia coerulea]|uniref:Uncharacterized protein n=1 Tax=Aquilegia coerulea TaxID=218851 RepID=A0A2G5EIH3_AQUCA|nr:hypothetical protein AQUCO_00700097v1 [Aquilegia coerulea]
MIVDDEQDIDIEDWSNDDSYCRVPDPIVVPPNRMMYIAGMVQRRRFLESRETHVQLKNDLKEHIWQMYGAGKLDF